MISAVLTRSTGQQHHPCSPDVLLQAVSIGDDRCQSLTIGQVHEQSKVPSHDEGVTRQCYKRNLMLQMIHYNCEGLMAGSKELSISGMPDHLVPTLAKMGQDRGAQQAYCSAAIITLTDRLDRGDPIRFTTTQIGGGRTTIRITNQSAETARREAARHRVSLSSFVITALLEHEGAG
jgi:hypothetical protein